MPTFVVKSSRRVLIAGLLVVSGCGVLSWGVLQQPRRLADVTVLSVRQTPNRYILDVSIIARSGTITNALRRSPRGKVETLTSLMIGSGFGTQRFSLHELVPSFSDPHRCELRLPIDAGDRITLHVQIGKRYRVSEADEVTLVSSSRSGSRLRSISIQTTCNHR